MKRIRTFLCTLTLVLLTSCALPSTSTPVSIPDGTLEVHFIDVGQADCILVLTEDETMLIDGGNVADSSLVVSYLTAQGIDDLTHVVCTHAHEDHVGGLSGALSQFSAGTVYSPVTEYDTTAFRNFVKYTEAQGLSLTVPSPGDNWTVGEAVVTVLAPQQNYSDANNTSIVLRLEFGEISFLFTGDAEYESEQDMLEAGINLEATVLKVGHHGSSTSTCYQFLREVNPQYGIIQCGVDNDYGHPHDEVLSRLRDADVSLYRNDLQGTIIATTDGETVTFSTDTGENVVTNPTEAEKSDATSEAVDSDAIFIGNLNSKAYHREDCSSLPAEQNQTFFSSQEEAEAEGYTPCGRCDP